MTPTTATPTGPAVPDRWIPTRRLAFDFAAEDLPRYFADGDLVFSHVLAVLSALFPEGEDFFVRSVRHYRDRISDPVLQKQVAGFIGQEAVHGRLHRRFNDRLADRGYPTRFVDRATGRRLALVARLAPPAYQLAVTAALEHYTATFAEVLLGDPRAQALSSVPEVRALFLWHALEESEHKAVAYDVFQHVCGSHRLRTRVMKATTVVFLGALAVHSALSLAADRRAWNPRRLLPSLARLGGNPFFEARVRERLRDYKRPDFHPDDHDATELLERWRAELFGSEGELAGMVTGAEGGS